VPAVGHGVTILLALTVFAWLVRARAEGGRPSR